MTPSISAARIPDVDSRFVRTAPYSSAVFLRWDATRKLAASLSFSNTPYLILVLPTSIASNISSTPYSALLPACGENKTDFCKILPKPSISAPADRPHDGVDGGRNCQIDGKFHQKIDARRDDDEKIKRAHPVGKTGGGDGVAHQKRA